MLKADAPPSPPAAADREDFGQYLVDHSAELGPFFDKNFEDLVRKAMPMVWGMLAWITLLSVLVGWVVDVILARAFTPFFAPAYAKVKRAIIYSTGRLVLSLAVMGVMALTVFCSVRFIHAGILNLIVGLILTIAAVVGQIAWLRYLFRMNVGSAAIFYIIFLGAQAITFILVATPILTGAPSMLAYRFVNETLTPQLQGDVDETNQELAGINQSRDATKAKITELQNQIAQDQAQQEKLSSEIEDKKNSESYLFQQGAKVEAAGDLASARDQFNAIVTKYPSGAMAPAVKARLAQIDSEMAAQAAKKKQDEATAAAAAAAAKADLLARAAKGEVTLSEMRRVLMGKSRTDVTELLGPPADSASDRWGYGQQMIYNPLTGVKHGLTVIFSNGVVQGVDLYYGVVTK
jgi:hypothetical protein